MNGFFHHLVDVTNHSASIRGSVYAEGRGFHAFTAQGRTSREEEATSSSIRRAVKDLAEHKKAGTIPMVKAPILSVKDRAASLYHEEVVKNLGAKGIPLPKDGKYRFYWGVFNHKEVSAKDALKEIGPILKSYASVKNCSVCLDLALTIDVGHVDNFMRNLHEGVCGQGISASQPSQSSSKRVSKRSKPSSQKTSVAKGGGVESPMKH
jgi:hypothetical protein